jgi:hypothetical protein
MKEEGRTGMAAAASQREPVGIVVRDGGEVHSQPRIMMWFWASEEEVPARELE